MRSVVTPWHGDRGRGRLCGGCGRSRHRPHRGVCRRVHRPGGLRRHVLRDVPDRCDPAARHRHAAAQRCGRGGVPRRRCVLRTGQHSGAEGPDLQQQSHPGSRGERRRERGGRRRRVPAFRG
ncbi:hypothetical protein ET495_15195 [Xylanimonas allomyrinae]|uniref:Uncharacterized protein n=1 Tax=Xylanimonas allomyrinae TaxID=2509459 RepID=A0A4P6F1X3_9MICO|nr:hypothetical protein ET495_15195 [Xylanimonas allomyrinae]